MVLTCHPHRPSQSLDDAVAMGPTDDVAYVVKERYIEVSRLSNGRADSASLVDQAGRCTVQPT